MAATFGQMVLPCHLVDKALMLQRGTATASPPSLSNAHEHLADIVARKILETWSERDGLGATGPQYRARCQLRQMMQQWEGAALERVAVCELRERHALQEGNSVRTFRV
jgi:hypothetical protein